MAPEFGALCEIDPLADHLFAFLVFRMRLAGKDELDGSRRIIQQTRQPRRIGEQQVRPLVTGEAPRKRSLPQAAVHNWSACGESQLGTCTPLVTWPTGTSGSGQRGNNGWKSRRLTRPCSRLTPKLCLEPRSARYAILNGSFPSFGPTRPNPMSSSSG